MNCLYLRHPLLKICTLPGLPKLVKVSCGGSQLECQFPLRLAEVEKEQIVDEDEPESGWARLVREEQEIRNGGR